MAFAWIVWEPISICSILLWPEGLYNAFYTVIFPVLWGGGGVISDSTVLPDFQSWVLTFQSAY